MHFMIFQHCFLQGLGILLRQFSSVSFIEFSSMQSATYSIFICVSPQSTSRFLILVIHDKDFNDSGKDRHLNLIVCTVKKS